MANSLFDQTLAGPPPGTATAGSSLWIDLGLIPNGFDYWIGQATYTSNYKIFALNLWTNKAVKSAGNLNDTDPLDSWTSSSKVKSTVRDLYKNGRLHIKTVISTGVEHWWLYLTSKSSSAQSYNYDLRYTLE
jgi:hypothetical protein